jgi:hypothetical protein
LRKRRRTWKIGAETTEEESEGNSRDEEGIRKEDTGKEHF